MKQSEWLRIVGVWARIWPNRQLPDESVGIWFELLQDLDGQQVGQALTSWANDPERSWPPQSPGELRSAAVVRDGTWTDAIGELATVIRRSGGIYGAPPDDLDPILASYITSMGGWRRLCETFDPSDATTRAQFRDHWTTQERRAARPAVAQLGGPILPALTEGQTDG